jgi:hypothetical protein
MTESSQRNSRFAGALDRLGASPVDRRTILRGVAAAGLGAGAAYATRVDPAQAFLATPNTKGSPVFKYYDVTDYGATGNGTTDDTAAIQAAVNAAPVQSVVFFPPGTYRITSTLQGKSEVSCIGTSAFATTIVADFTSGDMLNLTGRSGVLVADLTFSSKKARTSGYAINHEAFGGENRVCLHRLAIYAQYSAVNLSGTLDEIVDCVIDGFKHNGIDVLGGGDLLIDGVKIPATAEPPSGAGRGSISRQAQLSRLSIVTLSRATTTSGSTLLGVSSLSMRSTASSTQRLTGCM